MAPFAEKPTGAAAVEPAQIEVILAQIDTLPTLSPVAMQLVQLSMDERSGVRDLARLIASDPSLAARILARVRRADCAAETDSVERAVALLGMETVRSLVLSIEVFETFSHRLEAGSRYFDRMGFWKHALAVGCAAQLLASEGGSKPGAVAPEEAFLCGLLHDLGKIVLAACFPRTYDRVAEKADVCLTAIGDVEREVIGLDHMQAGRRLAGHWKLPRMIEESVWLHHQSPDAVPVRIAHPEHVRLVAAADALVRHLRIGYSGNHRAVTWPPEDIGTGPDAAERLTGRLFEMIEQRAEWIGLNSLSSQEMFQEALMRANAQLAQVNTRLAEANRQLQESADCFEALGVFKGALAEDPSHEEVCLAAAKAAQTILPGESLAFVGLSPARGVVLMGSASGERAQALRRDALPIKRVDEVTAWPVSSGWSSADLLSDVLRDRLGSLLDGPVGVWRPIVCAGRCAGFIVLRSEPAALAQPALAALCDWVGLWLNNTESRALAGRLNEDLAEMNRRLVDSQAEAARMRSLAMVGEMAAGAAHELNNPLAVISGRAQMLKADAKDEGMRRAGEVIAENARRASEIVNDLMEFAKPSPPQASAWPIAALLGRLRQGWLKRASLTEGQFTITISDDVGEVWADESQIEKLFDELIRNAVEAIRERPEPRLNINCWFDVADEQIVVRVEDNGSGMAPEVLERAMDPFFSHRAAGRGRGLGLSRAVRYAEINGGRIRLRSEPGQGTVVLVSLPTTRRA